jgi:putative membrane protein
MRHYHDYDGGWGHLGWIMPLAMMIVFVVLAVYLISRLTSGHHTAPIAPAAPPPTAGADAALVRARLRYAAGEIDRDQYVRLVRDLGGDVPLEQQPPG